MTTILTEYDKARLLSMSVTKRSTRELSVLIVPPIFVLFYSRTHDATDLLIWFLLFVPLAVISAYARLSYQREQSHASLEVLLNRWQSVFTLIWMLFGFFWAVPVLLTMGNAPFEFTLVLYMSLSGTTALAATSLAGTIRGFHLNFLACWGMISVLCYWSFPNHWMYLYPLTLIYGAAIMQHARGTNRFLIEQIALEKRSALLAQQHRAARDDANNALQAKSQFLATASHDLRQPVHAMGLLIEAARRRNKSEAIAPLLDELQNCVSSVTLMFNSLLDLSRIEAGVLPSRPQLVDLGGVFKDIEVMFKDDAIRRNLALRFRLPTHSRARVHADPALLRQALFNLVQNALRYTRAGGVLISVRKRRANWLIEIWDTGVGVADSDRERIFMPYERDVSAKAHDSEGLGLGLAVVKRCAAMLNADVGLSSTLGRGSRFWLQLPQMTSLALASASAIGAPRAAVSTAPRTTQRLIGGQCLIVEDDPLVISAWEALLAEWSVDVRFAGGSTTALIHLGAGFAPDVIFCDQRLRTGESGYQVLQSLLAVCPEAHGAMISGEYGAPELQQAEQDGYLVLKKPVDINQLHAILSRWIRRNQSEPVHSLTSR
jgi:signal transduction histidine kinase